MSYAEGARRVPRGGKTVRPQPVSDKSYMASVVDFFHDAYAGSAPVENDKIIWVKFEKPDVTDNMNHSQEAPDCPLFLVIGYTNGVQIWSILANGDAEEVLSLRQGPVRILRILPTPPHSKNHHQDKRPLVAICDGASSSQPFCSVTIRSLKTNEQVHAVSFKTPVVDIVCNKRLMIVALQEKIAAFDAASFKHRFIITSCYLAGPPNINPLALGTRWLAYADKKLIPSHQSGGGVCRDASKSYKATVIHAAKAITKGISVFSESLGKYASAKLSNSPPRSPESPGEKTSSSPPHRQGTPGIVTVVDASSLEGEFNVTDDSSGDGVVAHFQAHINEPVTAMTFDPSGRLLFTAGAQGHVFHIFRITSHPCRSGLGAVHHLYILYRGDTAAKVQHVSFTNDSRWVAVSTMRETTHVFPITPYGGHVCARTHTSQKIVNKESRFHKSAGLEELEETGRWSPVHGLSESPTSSGFHTPDSIASIPHNSTLNVAIGNPRLPPYPQTITILPLEQIKLSTTLSVVATSMAASTTKPVRGKAPTQSSGASEYSGLATCFAISRGHVQGANQVSREKDSTRVSPIPSLFIMSCHGFLVEYTLEPKATLPASVKKGDDSPLELVASMVSQWRLQRGINSPECNLRIPGNSLVHLFSDDVDRSIIATQGSLYQSLPRNESCESLTSAHSSSQDSDFDEPWLSQVEMVTHAGPHRHLWMGPQFVFKTVPQPSSTTILSSSSSALLTEGLETNRSAMDMTVDDMDLRSLRIQPLRSDPLPTPQARDGRVQRLSSCEGSAGASIEYGSGTFDHASNLLEVSCGSWPESYPNQQRSTEMLEEHLKQTIAEAMVESPSSETGPSSKLKGTSAPF
ncbi:breast carcinoma-amplified sequence 3-like isoform X2 [Lytechinus variegatus]|uniref:breast carcinoma-amplified sequence 3-like isoform X2 n=1 Tax=Lytechinus variegatus TaxID=7654 RepID=UPI001BB17B87|nr:breast carcinoma-amplified sequence 3-like isoform X2 [Lytechinus variegatus]